MMFCHIEDTLCYALAKLAIFLEPELCWSFKLKGHSETCDTDNIVSNSESPDQLYQPVGIDYYIIIGKSQYLSLCCHDTSIACPGRTWTIFTDVAYPWHVMVGLLNQMSSGLSSRCVIHDDDFIFR